VKKSALLVFLSILIFSVYSDDIASSPSQGGLALSAYADFVGLLDELNCSAVYEHIKYFASLGSRMSGYPGCDEASRYIYNYFNSVGLRNVTYDRFKVTVPVDYGASFQLITRSESGFKIYPMEPNYACPVVANGLTGSLTYVGDGDIEDLDEKVIEDAIVLMDYKSMDRWLTIASLGAKAVIFIEPADGSFSTIYDTLSKSTSFPSSYSLNDVLPFNFPRFYISYEDFSRLYGIMSSEPELIYANITARSIWEEREARNVMGFIEGEDKEHVLIISAHYDSYSVALSVAPGANDAVGVSVLLELARLLNMPQFKPKYTLLFIAFAGHHQILSGSRHFYFNYVLGDKTDLGKKIIGQVDLQLSTLSDTVATVNFDTWAGVPPSGTQIKYEEIDGYITNELIDAINCQTGKKLKLVSGCSGLMFPYDKLRFPMWRKTTDMGPMIANDRAGYALETVDFGGYLYSPMDSLDKIDLENLEMNAATSICVVYGLTQTEGLDEAFSRSVFKGTEWCQCFGGQVVVYNITTDWYDGKKALVLLRYTYHPDVCSMWPRPLAKFTEENGSFVFYVVPPARHPYEMDWAKINAFVINNDMGNIEYAPSRGERSWHSDFVKVGEWNTPGRYADKPDDIGFYVIFKCGTFVLNDIIYPRDLANRIALSISPLKWDSKTLPEEYYVQAKGGVTVACVPPDMPVGFLVKSPYRFTPIGVLANTTEDNPDGWGYTIKAGEQILFHRSRFLYALDLYRVSSRYIAGLEATKIAGTSKIVECRRQASIILEKAHAALLNLSYGGFLRYSVDAWGTILEAYEQARGTSVDIINVLPFFALLLIPFTFLFERLVFHAESGKKRIALMMLIFFITYAFFSFWHPSFRLASNPIMLVICCLIIFLVLPSIWMLLSFISRSLRKLMIKTIGLHIVEVGRTSAALLSFQNGIENMRKRKFRTFLMLLTVTLLVVGVTLFSSLTTIQTVRLKSLQITPPYEGILIYYPPAWGTPVTSSVAEYVKAAYPGEVDVSRISWLYSGATRDNPDVLLMISCGEKEHGLYVLMGIERPPFWLNFVNFTGRWFVEGETNSIILPKSVLDALDAHIGDKVRILDMDLTIVGSVDDRFLQDVTDLNTESILPIDRREEDLPPVPTDQLAIIPYDLIRQFKGSWLASITVIPKNSSMVKQISTEILKILKDINMVSGVGNEIIFYGFSTVIQVFGWQMQIVPVAIAGFMILNIILGSIKEREREIFIYSSVGLSPLHIAFMFLADSMIYAVVGGVLGYISAMALYQVISPITLGALEMNYSSLFVTSSLGGMMLVTIASAIYPAIKASRIVTPSLERAWRIKTKPMGDLWEIPLPIRLESDSDASGASNFLLEFINVQVGETGKFSPEKIEFSEDGELLEITSQMRLAPYDRGIKQEAKIQLVKDRTMNKWNVKLVLRRMDGSHSDWIRLVRGFIDDLRKQFLLWKAMSPEEKKRYISKK